MTDETRNDGDANKHSPILNALSALNRVLGLIEATIVGGGILLMAGLMSLHVLGRILFNHGIPGTTEVTEMTIIVITFIGVGYGVRHARHISMSAIYDQLTGRARKALLIVISVGTAILMFYFAWKSAEYAIAIHDRGRVSSSLRFPMWIVVSALPVGFTLAGIQYVLTTIRNLTSDDIYRSFTEKEEYSGVPEEPIADATDTHDNNNT